MNQMAGANQIVLQTKEQNLKIRILPPLVLAICLLQGAFVFTLFQYQKQRIAEAKQVATQKVQELLRDEMKRDTATMRAALEVIIRDPILTSALQARDREVLLKRAKPLFERLRSQNQITHFYFHQTNRVNLLRLHKDLQGDLINRVTLKRAEQTGKPSAGLEQGPTGNPVLRAVYPWRSDYSQRTDSELFIPPWRSELIGYVELGIEFEDIASRISKIIGVELIIAVDKQFLDRKQWEQRNQKLGRQSAWDDFSNLVIVDKTLGAVPQSLTQAIAQLPFNQNSDFQLSEKGEVQQVLFLPLMDLDGRNLGYAIVLADISGIVASANQSILASTAIAIAIGTALVLLFNILLGRVEQNLAERTAKLAAAKEELAGSHQQLAEVNHQLELYSQTLEQKVQERTWELNEQKGFLEQTLDRLQRTQSQLIHTEKMSSLGQLVAGVAHEINNPINFVAGNLKFVKRYAQDLLQLVQLYRQEYSQPNNAIQQQIEAIDLEFLNQDLPKLLNSMKGGTERISDIVLSLRNFSRLDESEFKPVDIHEGLDSTLMILQHRLNSTPETAIAIVKEYGQLPSIECYPGQLNQVFMNILTNAIDALEEASREQIALIDAPDSPPTIRIQTEQIEPDWVTIRIIDNGPGIDEETHFKLFDPFFTTKPVGKGTGLGLSISYQIVVEKHGGQLQCHSSPGQGAEFVIQIPIHPTSAQTTLAAA